MINLPELFNEDWTNFFELSHDGIVVANGEGRIVYMNTAAERLEEVGKEQILGRYAKELMDAGIYQNSVTVKVLKTRKTETVIDIKNNHHLVITGTPIFDTDQKTIKWIFINERDASELDEIKRELIEERSQLELYKKELERIKRMTDERGVFETNSPKMKQNMELIKRLAPTETSVLIEGESGTGKDVHARWIHENSLRASRPYVKIDCGALSESLLESELFGYEQGAFTGARKDGKKGLVEEADGGTLFLDEIGEMPLNLQVKLLRLVQERTFVPVGGVEEKHVDIRIVAATNQDLKKMVEEKAFREDLYYRLNVISIKLPPLRDRREDIFGFVQFFLKHYNEKHGYRKKISASALAALCSYSWPGNVRELSNVMERLVVITPKGNIERDDVVYAIPDYLNLDVMEAPGINTKYEEAVAQFEKGYLQNVMREGMTIKKTAEVIGVSESTLKRKLKRHNVTPKGGGIINDTRVSK